MSMSLRARLWSVPALIAILISGCTSSGTPQHSGASATSTQSQSAPKSRYPTSSAGLQALLVHRVPKGFVRKPDSYGDTGPSDLDKAIRDDRGAPDPRAVLTSAGFVRGYQRLWQQRDTAQVIVFIYQFGTRRGATSYERYSVREGERMLAKQHVSAHPFKVTGLPSDAVAVFARVHGRVVAQVECTVGPFALQVAANGPPQTPVRTNASTVAQAQSARLR